MICGRGVVAILYLVSLAVADNVQEDSFPEKAADTTSYNDVLLKHEDTSTWIDPNWMGIDDEILSPAKIHEEAVNCSAMNRSLETIILHRHVINLLNILDVSPSPDLESDMQPETFLIKVQISMSQLQNLRRFANETKEQEKSCKKSGPSLNQMHDVDSILSTMFQYRMDEPVTFSYGFSSWKLDSLPFFEEQKSFLIPLAVCGLYLTCWILLHFMKWWHLLALVSFFWEYILMYKELEVDDYITITKKDCNGSYLQFVTSIFYSQDKECKNFYDALMIAPIFKLSPAKVFFTSVVKWVTQPFKLIGASIGDFFTHIYSSTDSYFMVPFTLTAGFLFLSLLLMWIFRLKLRLPYFLGSIEPCGSDSLKQTKLLEQQQQTIAELQSQIEALRIEHQKVLAMSLSRKPSETPINVNIQIRPSGSILQSSSVKDLKTMVHDEVEQNEDAKNEELQLDPLPHVECLLSASSSSSPPAS